MSQDGLLKAVPLNSGAAHFSFFDKSPLPNVHVYRSLTLLHASKPQHAEALQFHNTKVVVKLDASKV